MKRKVEVESRRIGGTGLVVGQGQGAGQGQGVSQGEGRGVVVGQGVGVGAPCPVQAHSCACPTQEASPSTTPPQFAAAPQSTALRGSGRSPVSLASKGGVA